MLISCLHTPHDHVTLNSLQPSGPQPFGRVFTACVKLRDHTCGGLIQKVVALKQSACLRTSERVGVHP